ncbi:MAG: hypothetical protein NHB32_02760 [Fischerella sp. CENA71]|nr:hypothetical protein [Fischerella sp. CENA71]
MDAGYIQGFRDKIHKRVQRLKSLDHLSFHGGLKQFWSFIDRQPILVGILEDLACKHIKLKTDINNSFDIAIQANDSTFFYNCINHNDEIKHAATVYFILKKCIDSEREDIEQQVGRLCIGSGNLDLGLNKFKSLFIEPIYYYIDEQLDDQKVILYLIRRYKHKCEWFKREVLFEIWKKNTGKGERLLASKLYEYFHDQGIDFSIEPWSICGKPDLVISQENGISLIADAKIFDPETSRGKDYIAKGFNQVYQYTLEFNQPFGYLIIYKVCDKDLKFNLKHQTQTTQFIVFGNKTIFITVIDIFTHEQPASKRGIIKPIEITEKDLIKIIENE